MVDTDGFFYTKKESIFITPKDLSKEVKNYLKDNSTVEIEIYMSLLGSLDDQLKFVIPSIYEIYSLDDNYR